MTDQLLLTRLTSSLPPSISLSDHYCPFLYLDQVPYPNEYPIDSYWLDRKSNCIVQFGSIDVVLLLHLPSWLITLQNSPKT